MACKGKSGHSNEKPPWNVLKDVGWWPARCYFIVVAPSSCGMEQSLCMCCSQPQPQPFGCWPGALWKEHTHRSGVVSLIWSLFSGGKSPLGELEPRQGRQRAAHGREEPPKPPFAQGTVTLMPISGTALWSLPEGTVWVRAMRFPVQEVPKFPGSRPAVGTSRNHNGKASSCLQLLSLQALKQEAALLTSAKILPK